jgi:hypothetical protein
MKKEACAGKAARSLGASAHQTGFATRILGGQSRKKENLKKPPHEVT